MIRGLCTSYNAASQLGWELCHGWHPAFLLTSSKGGRGSGASPDSARPSPDEGGGLGDFLGSLQLGLGAGSAFQTNLPHGDDGRK